MKRGKEDEVEENIEADVVDAFKRIGNINEFKQEYKEYITSSPGAFRHLLLRLKSINEKNVSFYKKKPPLIVKYENPFYL